MEKWSLNQKWNNYRFNQALTESQRKLVNPQIRLLKMEKTGS